MRLFWWLSRWKIFSREFTVASGRKQRLTQSLSAWPRRSERGSTTCRWPETHRRDEVGQRNPERKRWYSNHQSTVLSWLGPKKEGDQDHVVLLVTQRSVSLHHSAALPSVGLDTSRCYLWRRVLKIIPRQVLASLKLSSLPEVSENEKNLQVAEAWTWIFFLWWRRLVSSRHYQEVTC